MRRWATMAGLAGSAGLVMLAAVGLSQPSEAEPVVPAATASLTIAQQQAFKAGDCNRCHHVPLMEDAGRLDSCEGCHVWIKGVSADPAKRAKALQVFPLWERYEKNVASYMEVPSLEAAMARLEPGWVEGYLNDPHDIRPNLPESMPRFGLEQGQIDAIISAFEARTVDAVATPAPSSKNLAKGETLFAQRGCIGCHTFGGRHTVGAVPMAPDLAHTRERMSPDRTAAWIRNPKSVSTHATMPVLALPEAEVVALRDYVLLADLNSKPAPVFSTVVQPTTEPVRWAEVEERVFGRICVHCHMDPDQNQGRAGPGNAGGFGFAATGIELQTRDGVAAVADRIPGALQRRAAEGHRDVVPAGSHPAALERPEKPGMPLGLPPLSDSDVALVLGWIEQGMPE
ncbi:MAG: cytochrome c [Myxococcota bacterium]